MSMFNCDPKQFRKLHGLATDEELQDSKDAAAKLAKQKRQAANKAAHAAEQRRLRDLRSKGGK